MKTLVSSLCLLLLAVAAHAATNVTVAKPVSLDGFKLIGDLGGDQASFTLSATAHVEDSKGGSLELLSGAVALTEAPTAKDWRIQVQGDRYIAVFDRSGYFPIQLKFNAAIRPSDPWKAVELPRRPQPAAADRPARPGRGHASSISPAPPGPSAKAATSPAFSPRTAP